MIVLQKLHVCMPADMIFCAKVNSSCIIGHPVQMASVSWRSFW